MTQSNKIGIMLEAFCILANLSPPAFHLYLTATPITDP